MTSFHGAYTALVTPFSKDGSTVDLERLAHNVGEQSRGVFAASSRVAPRGKPPTLSDVEHRLVIRHCVEAAAGTRLAVIAGAGGNCTRHAVEMHRFAAEAGAHATLQVNPYYNRPSQEGLYRHFSTIADAADLPVVLYHVPGRTGGRLSIETIRRLAGHPNIHAIKEASGSVDLAGEIAASTDLAVLAGDDSLTLPLAAVGGRGVVSVASNLVPRMVSQLWAAIVDRDWDEAVARHRQLLPLAAALLSLDTNPVPVKMAMQQLGWDSGALRLPLCPAGPDVARAIPSLLDEVRPAPAPLVAAGP